MPEAGFSVPEYGHPPKTPQQTQEQPQTRPPRVPGHVSQCTCWENGLRLRLLQQPYVGQTSSASGWFRDLGEKHWKVAPEVGGVNLDLVSRTYPFVCQLLPRNSPVPDPGPQGALPTPVVLCTI